MSDDLSPILNRWKFDPNTFMVRIVRGDEGRDKIQLRVDLGILQMEMDGRPDGRRPEGFESWLECYERRQEEHDETDPVSEPFMLGEEDCFRLWGEAMQYYHRYLSLWHLERYDLCARDTARNLRLFAFVRTYAQDDRHKRQFDQWRPYVLMMHARAVAVPLFHQSLFEDGLRAIDAGIDGIREFLDEYDQSDRAEECLELMSLERWREETLLKEERAAAARPQTAAELLRGQLEKAVAAEEFEEAARLRDRIRQLSDEARNLSGE